MTVISDDYTRIKILTVNEIVDLVMTEIVDRGCEDLAKQIDEMMWNQEMEWHEC